MPREHLPAPPERLLQSVLAAALKSFRPYHPAASYLYCCIPKSFRVRMILDRNESIWRLHVISSPDTTTRIRHAGPPLGIVATIFVVLFNAGLYPVTAFGGNPVFPGPGESVDLISAFFQTRPSAVLLCAVLQFGAAIPLGIFTANGRQPVALSGRPRGGYRDCFLRRPRDGSGNDRLFF